MDYSESYTNVGIEKLRQHTWNKSHKPLFRMEVNCPLFDFAYRSEKNIYHIFQTTISRDHSMDFNGMKRLLLAIELLCPDKHNKLKISKSKMTAHINFYWVVPYGNKKFWEGKKPKKLTKKVENTDYDIVNECVDVYVKQFVLSVRQIDDDDDVLQS